MTETRAARLNRLLAGAFPDQAEKVKDGNWGAAGAPYAFGVTRDGKRRLTVEVSETGERMGFVGDTTDSLLDQFEARVAPKG